MIITIGELLSNGARVLKYDDDKQVVLALFHDNEFVTWATDDKGNCFWGHYYPNIDEALEDYNDRIIHNESRPRN